MACQSDGAPHTFLFQRSNERVGPELPDLAADQAAKAWLFQQIAPGQYELHGQFNRRQLFGATNGVGRQSSSGPGQNSRGQGLALTPGREDLDRQGGDLGFIGRLDPRNEFIRLV